MIKMLVSFVSLFIIIFCGIDIFRKLTKKAKWDLAKTATYSLAVAAITFSVLAFIVLIF